jgi:hypothetical protein
VKIKVEERSGTNSKAPPIRFTALNSTYYPFNLVIDFIQFDNLSPRPPKRENKLKHGLNNLFLFSIQVPGNGYGYNYSYSYWLSPSDEVTNEEFPYLIPMSEGKIVNSKKTLSGKVSNSFLGEIGDTVFCMRKGLVTAVPRAETLDFRLSEHDCLEVLHEDGTYMIYYYLKKSDAFTAPGKIVLPGQPVGTISDSLYLKVMLIKLGSIKNLLVTQPIKYSIGKTLTASYDEIDGKEKSVHPLEIITLEMKSRESKKNKGK